MVNVKQLAIASAAGALGFASLYAFTKVGATTIPSSGVWNRNFRIRINGSGAPNLTVQDVTNILSPLPPMDHANRLTDGVPSSSSGASYFIDMINSILPLMRTGTTDHAVSARIAWSASWEQDAISWYQQVGSKCSYPQKAIAYDVPPTSAPANFAQGIKSLLAAGIKYISIGAFADHFLWGSSSANFAMLGSNPSTLQVQGNTSPFKSYYSISSHFDEPGEMSTFLHNYGSGNSLSKIESAWTQVFKNAPKGIYPIAQLRQGNLYNCTTGVAEYKGSRWQYPSASFFGNLVKLYVP